jgi:pimeloyl-ACP methyl ester carboxylesterase
MTSVAPITALLVVAGLAPARMQEPKTAARDLTVNGRSMHLWTSGLESRTAGQPVIILEGGGQGGVAMWQSIFPRIAELAPTIAYDRSGIGKSEFDGEPPTVKHVVGNLRVLLAVAKIAPPYILVGPSWGAVFIREFAATYPNDIAGLVYLDATDIERTCEELRAAFPTWPCSPKLMPPPKGMSPGAAAHMEQIQRYAQTEFAELRAVRISPHIPVAVVVGGKAPGSLPPNALTKNLNVLKLIQIRYQADWALSSRAGLLLASSQVGHDVVREDPALVLQALKHVLNHIASAGK